MTRVIISEDRVRVVSVGTQGPTGATGATGATGPAGAAGAPGQGVPTGGTPGQVLTKSSLTDYATNWTTLGSLATLSTVTLTSNVTGILPIANGGTNAASFTSSRVNYFNGTSIVSAAALTYATSGSHLTVTAQATTDVPLVAKGMASQSGNLFEAQDSSSNALAKVNASGYLGIGAGSNALRASLDIYNGIYLSSSTAGILLGADLSSTSTRTNATQKIGIFAAPHYNNANSPFSVLIPTSTSTDNLLYIGGGNAQFNAATQVLIHAAANSTTATGTQIIRADINGVYVGTGGPAAQKLDVDGNLRLRGNGTTVRFQIKSDTGAGIFPDVFSVGQGASPILSFGDSSIFSGIKFYPGSGTTLTLSNTGKVGIGLGTNYSTAMLEVQNNQSTTTVNQIIRAIASQSVHLLQLQDSSNAQLSAFDASGHLIVGSTITSTAMAADLAATAGNNGALRFMLRVKDDTTGFAAGIGSGISFGYKHDGTNYVDCGGICISKDNSTSGDSDTSLLLCTRRLGSIISGVRVSSGGSLLINTTTTNNKLFRIVGTSEFAGSSGTPGSQSTADPVLSVTAHSHTLTSLTASIEYSQIKLDLSPTTTFATGGITLQRAFQVLAPTYAFAGASTITNAITTEISGAPNAGTNATFTRAITLRLLAGQLNGIPLSILGASSQAGNYIEVRNSSDVLLTVINSSGYHGIGSGANALQGSIDIYNGNYLTGTAPALLLGADVGSTTTRTNSTRKIGSVTGKHYTNSQDPVSLFTLDNALTYNKVLIGGGSAGYTGSTQIEFYTAANTTTFTGTLRGSIDTNGQWLINGFGAGIVGQIVRGAASQTANLTEYQNSSGTAFVTVGPPTLTGASTTSNFLNVTGTLPSSQSAETRGVYFNITSAGSSGQVQGGILVDFNAGYSGTIATASGSFNNKITANVTGLFASGSANFGCTGGSQGSSTSGENCGAYGWAQGGILNVGIFGRSVSNKNSGTNIGAVGIALNGGSSPIQIGGFFGLTGSAPTLTSAALICDNGGTTSDIFVARDNGTAMVTITDGGHFAFDVTTGSKLGTATSQKLGFWNATPVIQQTTAVAPATITNGVGAAGKQDDTYDGYTVAQVVKALRTTGLLA